MKRKMPAESPCIFRFPYFLVPALIVVLGFVLYACGSNCDPASTSSSTQASVAVEMVLIPGGTFTMGSPSTEPNRFGTAPAPADTRENQHPATVSPFYIGKYEVTQEQWEAVMGIRANKSTFFDFKRPVENVTWFDAVQFCNKLSQINGLAPVYTITNIVSPFGSISSAVVTADWTKKGYRLPTDTEWECACRGDKNNPLAARAFAVGDGNKMIPGIANFNTQYPYDASAGGETDAGTAGTAARVMSTTTVGTYAPNSYGLYDMHGNVAEWCWDVGSSTISSVSDYRGPATSTPETAFRVFRGGGWMDKGQYVRSAVRQWRTPAYYGSDQGFRLARSQ